MSSPHLPAIRLRVIGSAKLIVTGHPVFEANLTVRMVPVAPKDSPRTKSTVFRELKCSHAPRSINGAHEFSIVGALIHFHSSEVE